MNKVESVSVVESTGDDATLIFGKIYEPSSNLSLFRGMTVTPSLTKKYRKRYLVDEALLTGNFLVDYVSPLLTGNLNVFSGRSNMGQLQTLHSIAESFLARNFAVGKEEHEYFVVYVTFSRKEASKLQEKFGVSKNFAVFTVPEQPSDSEYYYLPYTALNFCRRVLDSKKVIDNYSVLLCMDDAASFLFKEQKVFSLSNLNAPPSNFFAELYEECGRFKDHTFTAVINSEHTKANFEFSSHINKSMSDISSYADRVVEFKPQIAALKSKS